MAKKTGLGRGLDSLISGGGAVKKTISRKKTAVKASKPSSSKRLGSGKKAAKKTPAKKKKGSVAIEGTRPFPNRPVSSDGTRETAVGLYEIPVAQIIPNPHQPRKDFDEKSLRELAESIRAEGLLQPVVVRKEQDVFELIAGERRWRACELLKLKYIPARIMQATQKSSAVLSLIENLQREDLNPIEEAMGYASLMKDFDLTQERVAEQVGRSRATVANSLRLLQLHREIQGYLTKGLLSVGHAKVLLSLEAEEGRLLLARQSIERGWSVRELERQVEILRAGDKKKPARRTIPQAEQTAIDDLQKQLSSAFSTPVHLKHSPKKGRIIIEYYGNDDLQRIIEQMGLH
jgi:ParB family chromosome partitioning protein